ncbi:MAG: hypothetical protein V2B15_12415 [Bacteroidota bacterium]
MIFKIILVSFVLLALSMTGMMLNILVKKRGKFPAYRVGHNKDMHKLGISCVKHDEIRCHKKKPKEPLDCNGCQQLAG